MHFYDKTGKPVYEVPTKTGGMKPTDIKYAIEHDLYPSVTEVDKAVFVNEGLNIWIKGEIATWCYNNPPENSMELQDYLALAMKGGREKSVEAMDFGTILHDSVENRLITGSWEGCTEEVSPWIPYAEDFIAKHIVSIHATERPVTCIPLGIGGKIDFIGTIRDESGNEMDSILDWKTQGIKSKTTKSRGTEKDPKFYDSWIRQLAMYSAMVGWQDSDNPQEYAEMCIQSNEFLIQKMRNCVSVCIDSKEPSPFYLKIWDKENQSWGLTAAIQAVRLWYILKMKNHRPEGLIL